MNLVQLSMDDDESMDLVVIGSAAGNVTDDDNDELHLSYEDSETVLQSDAELVCRVCGDSATGMYLGALVCVPCKVLLSLYACLSVCLSERVSEQRCFTSHSTLYRSFWLRCVCLRLCILCLWIFIISQQHMKLTCYGAG